MVKKILFFSFLVTFSSFSYANAKAQGMDKAQLEKAIVEILEKKPEILFEIMEKNSVEFINTITQASEIARVEKLHTEWEKDLKVKKSIDIKNRPSLGENTAKNTVIGYSDFLCSYCGQAAQTVQNLIKSRNDTKFIFKSAPTTEASRTAMQWFHHLNALDSKKAWQFHDSIFANQKAFSTNPMAVIHELAQKLGYNPASMQGDIQKNISKLNAIIDTDIKELKSMGLVGTPNFIINNVVLRGAYPIQTFNDAISFTQK